MISQSSNSLKISTKETVHSVWIGSELSLLEQLSIRLFQAQGFNVALWLYDECEGIPPGVQIRDASEILPRSSIFGYQGRPNPILPNGGLGSFSFWSDQFQMKLLYEKGGFYSQLDVTMLAPLQKVSEVVFVRDGDSTQTCFMKLEQGSELALALFTELERTVNPKTMNRLSWLDSMDCVGRIVRERGFEEYYVPNEDFQNGISFSAKEPISKEVRLIHWWNASAGSRKRLPVRGTLYASLLERVGIWRPSLRGDFKVFSHRLREFSTKVRKKTSHAWGAR
jgi:hypothetical protein